MLITIAVAIVLTVIIWPLSMIGKGDPVAGSADDAELRILPVARVEMQKAVAPSDGKPRTAEVVYNTICKACHEAGVAGAPKPGDKADWGPRIAQGKEVLYKHAIEGFTGAKGMMPARGAGASLTDDEVKAAVDYMADQSV